MNTPRRKFLQQSATLAIGLPLLGCSSSTNEALLQSKYIDQIGLQLWTVRHQLEKDFSGTIATLAKQGYAQLEAMDTLQLDQLMPIAKDHGLKVESSFFLWTVLTDRWDLAEKAGKKKEDFPNGFDTVLERANKHGIQQLTLGYLLPGERTIEDYKKLAEAMNKAGEKCNAAGIQLNYHNHNFEFAAQDGEVPYDILRKAIDPSLAQFELDVFWASIAGVDPIALMKEMKGQVRILHLKDKLKGSPDVFDTGDVPPEAFKELGNGAVDIKGAIQLAEEVGVKYCFVEQDESPDPIQSTATSIQWLKNLKA